MCQNEFEYLLLEMHDNIMHNPKNMLRAMDVRKHNIKILFVT